MITYSHDEPYSVQIFFFGFIISSIVIINLENPQKLSKIIILSRIVHVIHWPQHPTSDQSSEQGKRRVESCKLKRSMQRRLHSTELI